MPQIPGLPVSRHDYPAGQAGVDVAVAKIVSYIHEGTTQPLASSSLKGSSGWRATRRMRPYQSPSRAGLRRLLRAT